MKEQINQIQISSPIDRKAWSDTVIRMHLYIIKVYLDRSDYSLDAKIRVLERIEQLYQTLRPKDSI